MHLQKVTVREWRLFIDYISPDNSQRFVLLSFCNHIIVTSLWVCIFTVDLSICLHTLCISSERLHSCIPTFVLHSFDCNPQNQPQPSRVNLSWKTLNVIRDVMRRGLLWQATLRRIFLDMQSLESLIKGGKWPPFAGCQGCATTKMTLEMTRRHAQSGQDVVETSHGLIAVGHDIISIGGKRR